MKSPAEYVNPFIGVDDGGNTLCGPYLPLSIVRLCPDTAQPQRTNGYRSDRPIIHFSHTHVSGTGGGGRYGNIGVMPFSGVLRTQVGAENKQDEEASAGYYAVTLADSGIRAELTSTPRAGCHRYTFPAGTVANILIDAGSVIQADGMMPGDINEDGTGASTGGFIEVVSDWELTGRGDYRGGWGHIFPYSVYFYARFGAAMDRVQLANHYGIIPNTVVDGANCRALVAFGETRQVDLVVGISYVSIAQARASVDREVGNRDFDTIRHEAVEIWNKALSIIQVEGGSEDHTTLFYSLFNRLLCMPSDLGVDDEFGYWRSGVRHFSDFYTFWDSVRNTNALITLFNPGLEVDFLNCLLDIADHKGWLPDAWIAGHQAGIQGGSSADVLYCEAALKGLKGIDYAKALKYMVKNNEVEPPDPMYAGRHLKDYRDLGYLSTNIRKNCVSRTMEYAYQDWCIGRLAEFLGDEATAQRQYNSARKVWNLWRDDIKFFAPRKPDGAWVDPFDPTYTVPDAWNDPYFYEATGMQWFWAVQHDFHGLIARMGGTKAFIERLDEFFDGGHYHSKEMMLHVPYLYIYAGRPDRTADRVRECLAKYFRVARNGIRDNEDMGCQSAFFMCSTMGLYPMMGQDLYLLTTPCFERTRITLGNSGNALTIEAPGAAQGRRYIASATLNGEPLNRAWLRHGEIAHGGDIRFQLADTAGKWGVDTPPPPLAGMS